MRKPQDRHNFNWPRIVGSPERAMPRFSARASWSRRSGTRILRTIVAASGRAKAAQVGFQLLESFQEFRVTSTIFKNDGLRSARKKVFIADLPADSLDLGPDPVH